jgi:hypothetical protein
MDNRLHSKGAIIGPNLDDEVIVNYATFEGLVGKI